MRLAVLAVCCLALAACVPGGGAGKPGKAAVAGAVTGASPITGGEVTVTALTPPPGAAPPAGGQAAAAAPTAAGSAPAPAPTPTPASPEPAKPQPAKADPVAQPADPAKSEAPLVIATSPEAVACRKAGGNWSKVGKAGHTCLKSTRDSGKSCTSGKQCEGLCLARSGTCAPFKPMFGCNEIFQDDGQRVTLCID